MCPEASTSLFPSMYLPKTPGSASSIAITVEESVLLTPRKIDFNQPLESWQILGSSKQIKNDCKKQTNGNTANDWEIES